MRSGLTLRRACCRLCLATLSALAIATPAAVRQLPSSDGVQFSGSARLTGRVVAADDGRPIKRATVSLSGLPPSQLNARPRTYVSRSVETDANGRFDFANLPAGLFRVGAAAASGFARQVRPKDVTLADGHTAEITIRLQRTGAIEGRIHDEDGVAMLGAQVHAVRRVSVGGYTTLTPVGAGTTTDDRGEFRLFNLPAGDYYVLATYSPSPVRNSPPPQSGYANTYYPGSREVRDARVVAVRSGRTTERINVGLAPSRFARLSIHPVNPAGAPLGRDAQFLLTRRDQIYLSSSTRYASRQEDGTFVFTGIEPGDYYVMATMGGSTDEAAYVNVSIADTDVSLNVQTNTGARVSGRVIINGRPAADGDSRPPNVHVSAYPPPGKNGPMYARVPLAQMDTTGRFELTGLRGPMVLHADVAGGALLSIRRRGEEIASKTVEFVGTETFDDLVVEVTTNVAHVEVSVTGANAREDSDPILVMLFPEDRTRWHHGYLRYDRVPEPFAATDAKGSPSTKARMTRVPPGRYLAAAIRDKDLDYPMNARLLETLRPLATPVTLVAGQTATVTVPVANVPR
jgi:carboxypeptidase family protein